MSLSKSLKETWTRCKLKHNIKVDLTEIETEDMVSAYKTRDRDQ
jgi:hypothetical protein